MLEFDPYAILGVARDCDDAALKVAYRRLVRDNHPDIAPDKTSATLKMAQINVAWSLVGDADKRAVFDAKWRLQERERLARERHAHGRSQQERERERPRQPPASSKTARPQPRPQPPSPPGAMRSSSKPASTSRSRAEKQAPAPSRSARLSEASRLLFKLNRPQEALEVCRAVLKTDFRNIPARELMGEAYLRLGQPDRAVAVWEQALVLAPNNIALRRRWQQLLSPEARRAQERDIAAQNAARASRVVPPRPASPAAPPPVPRPSVPSTFRQKASKAKPPGLLQRMLGFFKGR